jgi:thiamine transport system substrate-binding protein
LPALLVGGCGEDEEEPPTATTVRPATGTTAAEQGPAGAAGEVVLLTHDSFAMSDEVLQQFEERTGLTVRLLKGGDAGSMLNQAILTKDNPVADVLYGVDNTFLSRALEEDLFEPYKSALLADVPDELELDSGYRVTPIDYGDVCLNYDKEQVGEGGLPVPAALRDLTGEDYEGRLVVENPATSSPGLAFLLATVAQFGEEGAGGEQGAYSWQQFWRDLVQNDVLAVPGWEEAYYSEFSGGAGEGERPLVVSYASSPVAEVLFAEEPPAEAPTGVITEGAFRQIEFAGVLKGAENIEGGKKLIEFMLDLEFQQAVPENMFVFPANEKAELPAAFLEHTTVPERPLEMDFEEIGRNRDRWIEEWTEIVGG